MAEELACVKYQVNLFYLHDIDNIMGLFTERIYSVLYGFIRLEDDSQSKICELTEQIHSLYPTAEVVDVHRVVAKYFW